MLQRCNVMLPVLAQVEFLGRVQKQEQDDAWYTCINYISVCGKPLYGFVPAERGAPDRENHKGLLIEKVSADKIPTCSLWHCPCDSEQRCIER